MKHYAFVTRLIRWRMAVLFDIGHRVELVNTDRAGSWLVMGTDYRHLAQDVDAEMEAEK